MGTLDLWLRARFLPRITLLVTLGLAAVDPDAGCDCDKPDLDPKPPVVVVPPPHTEAVYRDVMGTHWHRAGAWSSTVTEVSGSHGGTTALAVHSLGFGGVPMSRSRSDGSVTYPMYKNQYKSLSFWYNPGDSVADDAALQISTPNDRGITFHSRITQPLAPNTWFFVEIPIDNALSNAPSFTNISFYNAGAGASDYVIDDVSLTWYDDAEAPVVSDMDAQRNLAGDAANIRFNTSEATLISLEWGSADFSLGSLTADYGREHHFYLSNLNPSLHYKIRIRATEHQEDPSVTPKVTTLETPIANRIASNATLVTANPMVSHPISPHIYGVNEIAQGSRFLRLGGNRWSAYNWETNASNAGSDFNFSNDGHLSESSVPGEAMRAPAASAIAAGASVLITVPMAGYVARDKAGSVDPAQYPSYLGSRFVRSLARKNAPLSLTPNTNDDAVYADEMANWAQHSFPAGRVFYSLDNEPELWSQTHREMHPAPVTYAELVSKTIDFAGAIRTVAPNAIIFGPVSYGWNGQRSLQDASDGAGRDFLDHYLSQVGNAIDVLDVHWYPEARADSDRITSESSRRDVVRARVQAPRSLWDSSYRETSWIQSSLGNEGIALIPRLKNKIGVRNTKVAITEYAYGGGEHISGAMAQADVLGIFGVQNVFAANHWNMHTSDNHFIDAAFALFLNYNGSGGHFGTTSIAATSTDQTMYSVYAATDGPNRATFVVINKSEAFKLLDLGVQGTAYTAAAAYSLTERSAQPSETAVSILTSGRAAYDMPPMSASIVVLTR